MLDDLAVGGDELAIVSKKIAIMGSFTGMHEDRVTTQRRRADTNDSFDSGRQKALVRDAGLDGVNGGVTCACVTEGKTLR